MATPPLMRLSTPLGDKLEFKRLDGAEELSRLYEYSVQALSTDNAITPAQLLGKPASVQLQLAGSAGDRHFHGLVTAMGLEGMDEGKYSYRLVLRPWLWLLTRRSDTRVFQNKNLQAILKEVFEPFSVDYKFQLSGSLPTYEYCVQYRESDFDFVSRLLEQEGVYYHFTHEKGKHTLVLVDRASAHPACAQAEVYYRETADTMLESETITGWQVLHEIQSGQAVLTDYDFEKPSTSLQSKSKAERSEASTQLEVYDHPGLYIDKAAGDRYSKLRVEELQAAWVRSSGGGSVRALATGHTFTLKEHPRADQNTRHLLVSTRIEAQYAGYRSGAADTFFRVRFTALPAAEQFRPARHTPKPLVHGPQTAVVVGPSGDEIHTDKYGRVKVQFHWDRLGKKDAASSCWVRVSHPSAGKGFGGIALPRIGQEVVVSFLDGDPDRPLITGRVYNAEQMPPLALPANATISTLRSRSSKGGGDSDFNELRFEDKKGDEHVWFQAQKDYYQHVKHDAQVVVDNNEAIIIGNARTEAIGGAATLSVAGDATQEFANNLSTTVATAHTHTVGAAQAVTVGANHILTIGGALLQNIGGAADVEVGGNYALQAAANLHIKAGANLVIEAGTMITLKAGGASVVIGGPGVSVTGSMVMINSGGAAGAGAGAKAEKAKKAEKPAKVQQKKDPVG